MQDVRIGFIGAGNMAQALARGLLRSGRVPAAQLQLSDPDSEKLAAFCSRAGLSAAASNPELCRWANVLFLAVKPQVAVQVLEECAPHLGGQSLIVSIVAGLSSATLAGPLSPPVRIVRAMPNTPALVGAGATSICSGPNATEQDMALAASLVESVGIAVRVGEAQMDVVTGLSGSGPAYVLTFLEALADGAVRCGLPRDIALRLSVQTVLGAAELAAQSGEHPAVLRDRVTSPGGTTAAGLAALEQGNFRHATASAVVQASARSRELGKNA